MPLVEFRPSGTTVECEELTEILEAARKAGVIITAPCGGKGTCGKCAVTLIKGEIEAVYAPDGKSILACKSKIITSDVILEVPPQDLSGFDRYEDNSEYASFIESVLVGTDVTFPVTAVAVNVPEPAPDAVRSDIDRLLAELTTGNYSPGYSLNTLRELPQKLRINNGQVVVWLGQNAAGSAIVHIDVEKRECYGIAIDLGTTTIAAQLIGIEKQTIIATRSAYNDQVNCGLDVISRINYARTGERLADLRERVLRTINRLIDTICTDENIAREQIIAAVISGNTVMVHLLAGVQPEYIRLAPYTPVVMTMPVLTAQDVQLTINSDAGVYISPAVGSYVGGDITAGMLCTDMIHEEVISLFIDIGTNGELVVGNREFLLTCACSAGPAFEGGNITCGMRAVAGAINRATIDVETARANYSTIDNDPARGICGSGMLDVLAELLRTRWMDAFGKFNRDKESAHIVREGKKAYYYPEPTLKDVYLTETDIENVMRAKAAIYSACSLLLEQVGIGFDDIAKIYIAGGFGKYVNIENAITLGLLPDVDRKKYVYLGNASLKGSALMVLSEQQKEMQKIITAKMTYIDLSNEPGFMDQYTAALFFPHTDFNKFPSVKRAQ